VRSRLEGSRLDVRIGLPAQECEGNALRALVPAESRREPEAVEHGHRDVEQHEVRHFGKRTLEPVLAVDRLDHVVPLGTQV
jgi:hypothetical protein